MKVLDLFSGIGGISLGLHRAGDFETVAFCEIEPFCQRVLKKNFPGVPIYEDITTLSGESFRGRRIHLICGGFPCQDISAAGIGVGIGGKRSGLWNEMFRLITEIRPRWVLAENVPALRTRGADVVLSDLESEGYTCWPLVVGARHIGAKHQRSRVYIVAHSNRVRELQSEGGKQDIRRRPYNCYEACFPSPPEHHRGRISEQPLFLQPEMGSATHGLPQRLVRRRNRMILKAAGNSVVPQVVEAIGLAILEVDSQ